MSKLIRINPTPASLYDIVFVHGLNGDGQTSWTEAGRLEDSWLAWLAADAPDIAVWSLSYDNKAVSWGANTIPLQDRATNILELLLSNSVGSRPLVFVCHSYGGLLVKQLLRSGVDSNELQKTSLVNNTRGVLFLATPHAGSDKATWFTHYATILWPSVAVAELQAHGAQLRDLNLWYRNNAERLGIETGVLFETKATKGLRIVDETSADPGIQGLTPIPVDADHVRICKPESKTSEVFLHARRFLRAWLSPDLTKTKGAAGIIVRIDWNSNSREAKDLIKVATEVASSAFPDTDDAFPKGSLLECSGGICLALKKPSVTIRAAIEFMQGWHALVLKGWPDCRITIGEGVISDSSKWRFLDVDPGLTGQLSIGCVYVSEAVVDAADPTMATFSIIRQSEQSAFAVFRAEFEDPRTVRDSSLIHAFFVAHPAAQSVRHRLIELFLVEYTMEIGGLTSVDGVVTWLRQRNYPNISQGMIFETLRSSAYFQRGEDETDPTYTLRDETRAQIEVERGTYSDAKRECLEIIRASLRESTGSADAVELADLPELVEEYLSAIFFEVRLMANYLRRTDQIFESSAQTLRKFDHIVNRRLKGLSEGASETWRASFIRGLKRAAESKNAYVATVFHNVLATYYLNRSPRTARHQLERLKGRTLYVDTNVLYAARVGASSYNEITTYLLTQLKHLGFDLRIFPFSIREFEDSLRNVDRAFREGVPDPWVVDTNPWIYQEFRLNHEAYLTFSACRKVHSIAKAEQFSDTDFDRIDAELAPLGIRLERDYESLDPEEISSRWKDLISQMGSNSWDLDRWWEFRHSAMNRGEKVVQHDVLCIHNVDAKARTAGTDEFGPRALLLTLDAEHLLRLRRAYPFIVGVRQCQEYFLPYLFLNDAPIKQMVEFPNQLLSAQLGMLLMKYRPTALDIVESALRSEKPLQLLNSAALPSGYRDVASSFNQERLRETVTRAAQNPELAAAAASNIADLFEFGRKEILSKEFSIRTRDEEIVRLRAELEKSKEESAKKGEALQKQIRTNRYIRSQSRGKKR